MLFAVQNRGFRPDVVVDMEELMDEHDMVGQNIYEHNMNKQDMNDSNNGRIKSFLSKALANTSNQILCVLKEASECQLFLPYGTTKVLCAIGMVYPAKQVHGKFILDSDMEGKNEESYKFTNVVQEAFGNMKWNLVECVRDISITQILDPICGLTTLLHNLEYYCTTLWANNKDVVEALNMRKLNNISQLQDTSVPIQLWDFIGQLHFRRFTTLGIAGLMCS
ncbi:hypothetical protein Tco_0529349 [Tanacetum coccineum]